MARNTGDFFKGTFANDGGGDGSYTKYFHGTGQNAVGTQSGAVIKIEHPDTAYTPYDEYDYLNHSDEPNAGDERFRRHLERHEGDQFDDSGRQFQDTGQLPLFTTHHTPPVLNYMTATKDATIPAMEVAAHAAEETRRRFGERPWASNNTSEHSTPMVNAGIKAGIIKGVIGKQAGEKAQVSNDMDWTSSLSDMSRARSDYAEDFSALPENDFKTTTDGWNGNFRRHDPLVVKTDMGNIKEEIKERQSTNPRLSASPKPSQFENIPLPGMDKI